MEASGFEAALSLVAKDKIDGAFYNSPSFACAVTGGTMKSIVKTSNQNCPIDLTLVLNQCDSKVSVTFKLNKSIWEGGTMSRLPYFEHCFHIIQSLCGADSVEFVVEHNGNSLARIPCVNGFKDLAVSVLPLLSSMKRLRRLCGHFGVDPIWNEASFLNDLSYFNQVEALVFDKQWKGCAKGIFNAVISDEKCISAIRKNKSKPAPFNVTSDMTYNLLGEELKLGRVSHDYSDMIAKVSKCKPAQRGPRPPKEYVVEYRPTSKSTLVLSTSGHNIPRNPA